MYDIKRRGGDTHIRYGDGTLHFNCISMYDLLAFERQKIFNINHGSFAAAPARARARARARAFDLSKSLTLFPHAPLPNLHSPLPPPHSFQSKALTYPPNKTPNNQPRPQNPPHNVIARPVPDRSTPLAPCFKSPSHVVSGAFPSFSPRA